MAWEIPKNFVTARPGRLHGGGNHISKLLKLLLITEYSLISKKSPISTVISDKYYGYRSNIAFFNRTFPVSQN